MATRHASCSCGQLNVTTTGEPIRISVCHCLACQRRTGSAFGAQVRFARSDMVVEGRSSKYVRVADSGNTLTFHFCPDCGATVHYSVQHIPDVIGVPLGAFIERDLPPPKFSVYESRQHPWVHIDADVERSD
jgi:hypothetical protein